MTAISSLQGPPVLSTPDTNIFEVGTAQVDGSNLQKLSDDQLYITYEIERTVKEIRAGKWQRIALQFPDTHLVNAPRVYKALSRQLRRTPKQTRADDEPVRPSGSLEKAVEIEVAGHLSPTGTKALPESEEALFILGDTSYGACCVDEIAAQHGNADVVVHYGRSCLSPTARLPVIFCFTKPPLNTLAVSEAIRKSYSNHKEKIIIMADVPYSTYVSPIAQILVREGYSNIFATTVRHDISSPLPNRTLPPEVELDSQKLIEYHLFHIADPPASLLLTLSSRVASIRIFSTNDLPTQTDSLTTPQLTTSTSSRLNRRYALVTSVSKVPIFGILINTLSVQNYMHIVKHVQAQIALAGKKSYTFVVGKVNAAKIANFSEVGAWVVVGCWESSLLESKDFWKPIITPFELQLALQSDAERIWTGEWISDFHAVLNAAAGNVSAAGEGDATLNGDAALDSDEESAPPEFDLRTGRYVSHTRPLKPMATRQRTSSDEVAQGEGGRQLTRIGNREVATIGGVASPGAEFLRTSRTWRGLGSDFDNASAEDDGELGKVNGAIIEQGRSGIARGYVVGNEETRR